ncbi:phage baseplate protein [Streptomyces sp. NPDC054796]
MERSEPERPNRRAALGFGAAVALTAALPARKAFAAPGADVPGTHGGHSGTLGFSGKEVLGVTGPGRALLSNRKLYHSTVMQSFGFDERRGHLYALQVMQGGVRLRGEPRAYSHSEREDRGDLCLNRLDMKGRRLGHMFLKGVGHGGALGIEPLKDRTVLWTEWDAAPRSGYGRGVCRFSFANGKVLTSQSLRDSSYRPKPGSTNNYVTLDVAHGRVLLHYRRDDEPWFAVYALDRFLARDFRPLIEFQRPATDLRLPFQGMTLYDSSAYQMLGSAYGPKNPRSSGGNTRLFRIDVRSGVTLENTLDRTAPGLNPREPEGLAVLNTKKGPQLCMGFAHGKARARRFSLFMKDIGWSAL